MNFLTTPVLYGLAGVLALLAAHDAFQTFYRIPSLERDVAQCNEAKADLESNLREQNRAITVLHETTAAAQQKAASAIAAAEDVGRARQDEIDALQGRILKSRERTCAPALVEIRRMLK